MSSFNKDFFNQFIIENDIVGFFKDPITLKSGRSSNWYANWRNISEDAFLTDQLTNFVISFIEDNNLNPDVIYGVPEGATKVGIIAQFKLAKKSKNYGKGSHTIAMGRGKPKEHGVPKDKYFVGAPKGKIVVIEDVTTTGESLISTLKVLKNIEEVKVVAAIGLFNRMEKRDDGLSVMEKISEMGIKYLPMSTAFDVLPNVIKKYQPSNEIVNELKEYFVKYGVNELSLN